MQKSFFLERKHKLEAEILSLESQLEKLPDGNLICYKKTKNNKKYSEWYKEIITSDGVKKIYIPKKDYSQAQILAAKTYKHRLLYDKKNELESINRYLSHRTNERYSTMLDSDSPYRELLISSEDWEHIPYEKSQDYPEQLIVPAPKGEFVRSKSEAMIAYALYENNIPYRYEWIHCLSGTNIASDFTILHPKYNYEIIWEHFGLLDKPQYNSTISYKLPKYLNEGYLPGYNLIMTFENSAHPLDFMEITEIINKYFL